MNKTTKKPGKRLSAENIATGKRLLKYIMDLYKYRFIMVFICILLSAVASISVSLSLKYLLDDYIIPLIGQKSPNYTELYRALTVLGCIFLVGVIATFTYTRMMVYIGQGVLKKVRDDMFEHMQTLPIRYFDQNTNGSIMSLYTNDTDTLRQMISQAIPQALMSFFTIVVTFISMLVLSPLLTVLAVLIIGVLISATKAIGANSGKYFIRQQMALADVTGFIEERMNGQRVIKVFNHEEISEKEFDELNDALFECAANANKYANMMGPVIGNIGNLQFVLTAVLGGLLSVTGVGGITIGVIASYLQFTKSFTQPFMQVAQQFNSIVMALAGAERIFKLIDEEPEQDTGSVTLVNAKKDENGTITECTERTGMWAWKKPADENGTVTYTELTGDVRFKDVTFGYDEDKIILHDISLFAKPGQKLAFVGSTGAGKTTILHTVSGLLTPKEGTITFEGQDLVKIPGHKIVSMGMAHVPEGRRVFAQLSVLQNLMMGAYTRKDKEEIAQTLETVFDRFPRLKERQNQMAGTLSGGEQQMLAMGRALMSHPKIILMDEPSMGLSPIFVNEIFDIIQEVSKSGTTVLLVEQNAKKALSIADRAYVLETGKIVLEGKASDLLNNDSIKKAYLGE